MFTLMFGDYTFPNLTFEVKKSPLNNNIKDNTIPRQHGSVIQAPYLKSRTIRISGILHNASNETTLTQLLSMQQALLSGEKPFYYRSDRFINCFLKSINPDDEDGTDKAVVNIDIDLIAQDPFFYSAGASYSTAQDVVKGTTKSFDVFSGGNVFSEPKFSICATGGTIVNDIWFKNITTGKTARFVGTIPNGVTVTIDSKNLTVLNNLVDGLSNYDGDFITLDAGTNSFQVVGATHRFTVDHKYRWNA